jgi:hypothetical protein
MILPDYAEMSARLTYELIQVQRALANGSPVDSIPSSTSPDSPEEPSSLAIVVNSLWFGSIALSLFTALAAVLVKQWLRQYVALPLGTPRDRACLRHFRYLGFQQWQVATIVGLLPIIIYISVGLFLGGLVVLLFPLQPVVAEVVAVISGVAAVFFILTSVLPAVVTSCPYRTPMSEFVHWLYALAHRAFSNFLLLLGSNRNASEAPMTFRQAEKVTVQRHDELFIEAALWLYEVTPNPAVRAVVRHGIGGLPENKRRAVISEDVRENLHHDLQTDLAKHGSFKQGAMSFSGIAMEEQVERLTRSAVRIGLNSPHSEPFSGIDGQHNELDVYSINMELAHTTASLALGTARPFRITDINPVTQHFFERPDIKLPLFLWKALWARLAKHNPIVDQYTLAMRLKDLAWYMHEPDPSRRTSQAGSLEVCSMRTAFILAPHESLQFIRTVAPIPQNSLYSTMISHLTAHSTRRDNLAAIGLHLFIWFLGGTETSLEDDAAQSGLLVDVFEDGLFFLCRAMCTPWRVPSVVEQRQLYVTFCEQNLFTSKTLTQTHQHPNRESNRFIPLRSAVLDMYTACLGSAPPPLTIMTQLNTEGLDRGYAQSSRYPLWNFFLGAGEERAFKSVEEYVERKRESLASQGGDTGLILIAYVSGLKDQGRIGEKAHEAMLDPNILAGMVLCVHTPGQPSRLRSFLGYAFSVVEDLDIWRHSRVIAETQIKSMARAPDAEASSPFQLNITKSTLQYYDALRILDNSIQVSLF